MQSDNSEYIDEFGNFSDKPPVPQRPHAFAPCSNRVVLPSGLGFMLTYERPLREYPYDGGASRLHPPTRHSPLGPFAQYYWDTIGIPGR